MTMFTPELTKNDTPEFHLVANHYLETEEGLSLSLEFIRARIEFGRRNVPNPRDATFVVHYDLRGQSVPADIETILRTALAGCCEVRVKS